MSTRRVYPTPASTTPQDLGFAIRRPMKYQAPLSIARTLAVTVRDILFGVERERRDPVGQPLPEYEHPELSYAEHSQLWFDFVADTGDGFDATYTVARVLAASQLQVGPHATYRGQLLVLGGDLVYPLPSRRAYRDRVVGPYRAALPVEDAVAAPDAVALPGTHDWIDELAAFRTTFTQGGWFGSWRLRQTRSYIAIALPHRYWLWGIDVGLGVDVEPQRKYFQDASQRLLSGDRVIVCGYHPLWQQIDDTDLDQLQAISDLIANRGAEIVLQLSGKRHYYARYRYQSTSPAAAEAHAIVCGGGGAFLEDSSAAPEQVSVPLRPSHVSVERRECFPTPEQSKKIAAKGLVTLPARALRLALIGGGIWWLGLYPSLSALQPQAIRASWPTAFSEMRGLGLAAAFAVVWSLTLVLARQGRARLDRLAWVMGTAHALAHLATASAVALFVASQIPDSWERHAVLLGALSLSNPIALAMYFALARLADQHRGEVLPTLGVEDWKSFVRLHISADGTLHIFPVGIPEVPKDWELRRTGADDRPWFERAGDESISDLVRLIHEPVVVPPNKAQRDALTAPVPVVREPPYDVFISYSRADAAWIRTFLDAVTAAFVAAGIMDLRVFIDTESLRLREYWRTRILNEIARCSSFVAIWSPAYVAAYNAQGMCFEEYEEARHRALSDPKLVFDVYAKAIKAIEAPGVGKRQVSHLVDLAPEALPSAPAFKTLCDAMMERVHERRSTPAVQQAPADS